MSPPSERRLAVDPGPPPAPPVEGEPPIEDAELVEPGTALVQLEEWEVATVGMLLKVPLFGLHVTVGRDGPPRAFLPDDDELHEIAAPATRMLNKSDRLRRLAGRVDPIAFAGLLGIFLVNEAREVAAWKAGEAPADAPPDMDVVDLGVAAYANEGERREAEVRLAGVRRWRPPVVPDEDGAA